MLIEFRVANFRSFKGEQVFSLVASKDSSCPGNLIPCEKFNLLKGAVIYGPNASGKSNLVKAISFMDWFIRNSATRMNQGDKIDDIIPFRLAVESRTQPSLFEITMLVKGVRYEYGFTATTDRVFDEWLVACPPEGRRQRWLERQCNVETGQTSWAFRGPLKSVKKILRERTRDNGLALSRGAELNIKLLSDLFMWIREKLWVFDLSNRPVALMHKTAERFKHDHIFRERVIELVRQADFGIERITVGDDFIRPQDLPEKLKSLLSEKAMRDMVSSSFNVHTIHKVHGTDIEERFDFEKDESNGTQRFFAFAGPFLDALSRGVVMIVDELESNMHPLLTRKLVELFQSPEANRRGAQLILATHDSTLMEPTLFRRDQIWLVEKNEKGASEIFSLYDFKPKDRPRSTEAFQKHYMSGRYGGVPSFGPIFENLEIN